MDLRRSFDSMLDQAMADALCEAGFAKHRLALTRRRRFWVEHFIFQRDKYNLNKIRCRYYLNVGLEFPMLPPAALWVFRRMSGMVNWRGKQSVSLIHAGPEVAWATRAESLVAGLPREWEVVPATDFELLRPQVTAAILAVAQELRPWARSLIGRVCFSWLVGWFFAPFVKVDRPNRPRPKAAPLSR